MKNAAKLCVIFLIFLFIAGNISCIRDEPPPYQYILKVVPAPVDLRVSMGDGKAYLEWTYEDTVEVSEFRVYRKDSSATVFHKVGETTTTFFTDSLLSNGITYLYKVAAVDLTGYEGIHSSEVSVRPSIFSLIIGDGAEATNMRDVEMKIIAPEDTEYMSIANDSTFEGSSWEPYVSTRTWSLSLEDGLKTVYVKFKNGDGQEVEDLIYDSIILDTRAQIEWVQHDGDSRILKSGDVLHISLKSQELSGRALVSIVNISAETQVVVVANIELYDNGLWGDLVASDGIYEVDYTVDDNLEIQGGLVRGQFQDALGNEAPTVNATNYVNVNQLPKPVVLQEPARTSSSSPELVLRWTLNSDADFSSYQIFRSTDYIVTLATTLVAEVTDSRTTSFIDTDLQPSTLYYYRIYVFDTGGNYAASNIVFAATAENSIPQPIILSQPIQDGDDLILTWSPSVEADFANYRLFRSTLVEPDTSYTLIRIINTASTTEFRDVSVVSDIDYYYQIFVFDQFGLSAGSNIVHGRVDSSYNSYLNDLSF